MTQPSEVRIVSAAWGEPAAPSAGEVRVWAITLTNPPLPTDVLFTTLTPDEQERARRYKVEKPRQQFVTGRGLLRRLLGELCSLAPAEVPITYTGAGKPVLEAHTNLHFNVTHTDGLALIAVADRPVGIDAERVREVANPDGLVERFFSAAECESYRSLATGLRPRGFFRGWTCKEAIIKAAGLSVACLGEFDVELHPLRPAALLNARHPALVGAGWSVSTWEPAAGYAAALAVGSG